MLLNALISNSLLDILHGRQLAFQFFRQVAGDLIGTDTDRLAHVLERILCHEVILALAEQQTNRGIVLLFFQDTIHGREVEVMAYGGGFVGEVDDGYGAGNSTFTNCYVANCTVISETDDSQGTSFSGGFAGEITDSTLTIQNCYVYQATLSTVGNAVPQGTGVFAGNLWGAVRLLIQTATTERAE